jgi:hypothetical protein
MRELRLVASMAVQEQFGPALGACAKLLPDHLCWYRLPIQLSGPPAPNHQQPLVQFKMSIGETTRCLSQDFAAPLQVAPDGLAECVNAAIDREITGLVARQLVESLGDYSGDLDVEIDFAASKSATP